MSPATTKITSSRALSRSPPTLALRPHSSHRRQKPNCPAVHHFSSPRAFNPAPVRVARSRTQPRLFQRDEAGGVGSADTGAAVTDGLVGDGVLTQVSADHLGLHSGGRRKRTCQPPCRINGCMERQYYDAVNHPTAPPPRCRAHLLHCASVRHKLPSMPCALEVPKRSSPSSTCSPTYCGRVLGACYPGPYSGRAQRLLPRALQAANTGQQSQDTRATNTASPIETPTRQLSQSIPRRPSPREIFTDLDLLTVDDLVVVDSFDGADHLGDDGHVTKVGLDAAGLLTDRAVLWGKRQRKSVSIALVYTIDFRLSSCTCATPSA